MDCSDCLNWWACITWTTSPSVAASHMADAWLFTISRACDCSHRDIGTLLPHNQRQHRTLHLQKDVLPCALFTDTRDFVVVSAIWPTLGCSLSAAPATAHTRGGCCLLIRKHDQITPTREIKRHVGALAREHPIVRDLPRDCSRTPDIPWRRQPPPCR